ncbi:hypothetical protein [Pedobacter sp.]
MKRFIIGILILISAKTFAQVDGNYNYSIGIKAFNLMQMPKILQQANTDDNIKSWVNGGIIRFNDNQIAFRISGYYLYKRDFTFNNQCDNCETAKGSLNDYAIKFGFEKNFNYSVIQPYFAADFGFRSNSFQGNLQAKNPALLNSSYAANTSKNGGTFSPLLGLKFNVLNQVSLFAESSIEFYYSYERQETVMNDLSNTRTFARYNKLETFLNPISIGIQFHLVGKN